MTWPLSAPLVNFLPKRLLFVVQILESLGFIINKEKSVLIPSQKIVFLGYVIDSVAMTVSLPEEKLN